MSGRFIDEYLDPCVFSYQFVSSPVWSTQITRSASGAESVMQKWQHPLWRYQSPEGVRSMDIFNALYNHWFIMRGPAHTFPLRDPLDFASVPLSRPNGEPTISGMDQVIGTGNGATTIFQLKKTYTVGAYSYERIIHLPVVDSVIVTINGVVQAPSTYEIKRYGGTITFDTAPGLGLVVRAGYLFDVEVRFENDEAFDGIVQTYNAGGFADVSLIEVRPC